MNKNKSPRLFIGCPLDEQSVNTLLLSRDIFLKDHCTKEQRASIRLVPSKNYHITLTFLGDYPTHLITTLESQIETISHKYHQMAFNAHSIGPFPHSIGKLLAVYSNNENYQSLSSLHESLSRSLGIETKVPFRPHVTLARDFKYKETDLAYQNLQLRIPIKKVCLYCSKLSPTGSNYEVLSSFPLNAFEY